MDKFQNMWLENVTITQHSVLDPDTKVAYQMKSHLLFLRGSQISQIILPKDTIDKYIGQCNEKKNEEQLGEDNEFEPKVVEPEEEKTEVSAPPKRQTAFGRGQRSAPQEDQTDLPSRPQEITTQKKYENMLPKTGKSKAFGRGSRPPPEEQNPSLSQRELDEIIEKIVKQNDQMVAQQKLIEKVFEDQNQPQQQTRPHQSKRGSNQQKSEQQQIQDLQNTLKAINQQQIKIAQNTYEKNRKQKQEEETARKEKDLEKKMVFPNLQNLMDLNPTEFKTIYEKANQEKLKENKAMN